MGKSAGKPPKTPDPYVVSDAQTQSNQRTAAFDAALNRFNTYTPYGSQEYRQNGVDPTTGAPIYEQRINLSPEQQQILDQQNQQNIQLGNIANNQLSNMGELYARAIDPSFASTARQQAQDAIYDRNTAYLDKDFARFEDRERNRLANQGIVEGSEAYRNAMGDFSQGREMAYRQARNDAIASGGTESDRAMSQLFALRNQPLNEFAALRNAAPIQNPNFQGPAHIGMNPTDVSGNVWGAHNANMNLYNSRAASANQFNQGLFNLAGNAMMMFSDRRLKSDIVQIGELPSGLPVYSYTIDGQKQIGVMADEVQKVFPDAVSKSDDGYLMVNYAMVH